MRLLRVLAIVLGLAVGFPLGCVVLWVTMQLRMVAQTTQPTPEVLPAVLLADKGAPDNLYVEVTDFTFGKPVVESNEKGWECAWLPVEPVPARKKAAKYTLFFRADVRDQAALDEVVKATRLEALVANALPDGSHWRVKSGPALRKAYPKLDMRQAVFLAEPRLSLAGRSVALSDPRLYHPGYEPLGAWGGAGLLLFAFFGLTLTMKRGEGDTATSPPDAEALRAQVKGERPLSSHRAKFGRLFPGICFYGLLTGALLLVSAALTSIAVRSQREGKPLIAVGQVFFGLMTLLGARTAARACGRRLRWPTDIEVCPTGLSWRQGRRRRIVLWSEVADVARQVKEVPRPIYPGGLVGAMAALNNPQPPIRIDTLTITLHSGESYQMAGDVLTDYGGFVESVRTVWVEHEYKGQFGGVTGAWLKSRTKR
jgi:hypothetical protein